MTHKVHNFARRSRGFTLVELLVVIGILVILAGLIAAMAMRGRDRAERVRIEADLQGIAVALEAYKQDFGDYPRISSAQTFPHPMSAGDLDNAGLITGAELLCWALIGPYPVPGAAVDFAPNDGADGPGFRQRGPRGRVYGPYLNVDTYKFTDTATLGGGDYQRYQYIKDYHGQPVLYFAARNPRPPADAFAGAGKNYLYDFRDNAPYFYRPNFGDAVRALDRFCVVLGVIKDDDDDDEGALKNDEVPFNQGPFVLWSAGGDLKFGPDDPLDRGCDDVLVPIQ